MPIYNINKNANLEVENDIIKHRVPLIELPTEEIIDIEKDIKRKVKQIEHEPYYLTPFRVEIINSSVVYYYNAKNLKSFQYLRQLEFTDKLVYFKSLIEIAKRSDETKVTWNRHNFVVDPYEDKIKAIIFETEYLKMQEKTNVLEGIKEIILMALTTLNSVIGKPRKVDFIDQDPEIINFAETILLKIEDIDDLDNYIETQIIEFTHGTANKETSATDNNEPSKKKKLNFKSIQKPKKKKIHQPNRTTKKKAFNLSSKELLMYGGLGVLLLAGILLNVLPNNSETTETDSTSNNTTTSPVVESVAEENEDNENNKSEDETNTNEDISSISPSEHDQEILLAYRFSLNGDNDEALKILEDIGYNNLSESDQNIMLNIYQEKDMWKKIIQLEPDRAEKVVNYLIAEEQTDELIDIKENTDTDNPYVIFEVAYLQGDWEKVIKTKDKVKINGRKETQITEAYLNLNRVEEAEQFAEEVGNPDLERLIERHK